MGKSKDLAIQEREKEVLDLTPSSREMAIKYIERLPKLVEEGEVHALDAYGFTHELEKKFKETKAKVKEHAIEQITLGETARYGKTFSVRSGATRYSYAGISEVEDLEAKLKAVKEKYKQMYLAKQKGAVHANVNEDGEVLPLPTPMYSADSIVVK